MAHESGFIPLSSFVALDRSELRGSVVEHNYNNESCNSARLGARNIHSRSHCDRFRISRQDEANAGPDDRSAGGLRDVHGTDGRLHPPAGEELRGRTGLSGW